MGKGLSSEPAIYVAPKAPQMVNGADLEPRQGCATRLIVCTFKALLVVAGLVTMPAAVLYIGDCDRNGVSDGRDLINNIGLRLRQIPSGLNNLTGELVRALAEYMLSAVHSMQDFFENYCDEAKCEELIAELNEIRTRLNEILQNAGDFSAGVLEDLLEIKSRLVGLIGENHFDE